VQGGSTASHHGHIEITIVLFSDIFMEIADDRREEEWDLVPLAYHRMASSLSAMC
jgi:hypothetical protein